VRRERPSPLAAAPKKSPKTGFKIDEYGFVATVKTLATCNPPRVEKALDMWEKLRAGKYSHATLDTRCANAVMAACNSAQRVDEGLAVFDDLLAGKLGKHVRPDEASVATALALCSHRQLVPKAESILTAVLAGDMTGVTVNPHILSAALTVYSRTQPPNLPAARHMFDTAAKGNLIAGSGTTISQQCVNVMVSMYGKVGDVPAAMEFWKKLVCGGFGRHVVHVPSTRAITSMLRMFGTHGCPTDWIVSVLNWFLEPASDNQTTPPANVTFASRDEDDEKRGAAVHVEYPRPDGMAVTAMLGAFRRRRRHDLAEVWLRKLGPLAQSDLSKDPFVVKAIKGMFSDEDAATLVRNLSK
jgi:hypothetical protein